MGLVHSWLRARRLEPPPSLRSEGEGVVDLYLAFSFREYSEGEEAGHGRKQVPSTPNETTKGSWSPWRKA
jgi:hypothetical protein